MGGVSGLAHPPVSSLRASVAFAAAVSTTACSAIAAVSIVATSTSAAATASVGGSVVGKALPSCCVSSRVWIEGECTF